jgi:predicted ArsR family transcriptional regulator
MDLFSYADQYPFRPGWKGRETSRAAAEATPAQLLRGKVLAEFHRQQYMTADECAEALGLSVLSVRPRVTELGNMHKLMDSGFRRQNASGRSAIVWRVVK